MPSQLGRIVDTGPLADTDLVRIYGVPSAPTIEATAFILASASRQARSFGRAQRGSAAGSALPQRSILAQIQSGVAAVTVHNH